MDKKIVSIQDHLKHRIHRPTLIVSHGQGPTSLGITVRIGVDTRGDTDGLVNPPRE